MKTLVATQEVWYDSKKRNPGDQFNATDIDALILTAHDVHGGPRARLAELPAAAPVAKAAPPPAPEPPKVEPTQAKALEAEEPAKEEPQPDLQAGGEEAVGRRRYKRRDLKAEGE